MSALLPHVLSSKKTQSHRTSRRREPSLSHIKSGLRPVIRHMSMYSTCIKVKARFESSVKNLRIKLLRGSVVSVASALVWLVLSEVHGRHATARELRLTIVHFVHDEPSRSCGPLQPETTWADATRKTADAPFYSGITPSTGACLQGIKVHTEFVPALVQQVMSGLFLHDFFRMGSEHNMALLDHRSSMKLRSPMWCHVGQMRVSSRQVVHSWPCPISYSRDSVATQRPRPELAYGRACRQPAGAYYPVDHFPSRLLSMSFSERQAKPMSNSMHVGHEDSGTTPGGLDPLDSACGATRGPVVQP
nr:hypothetical protein CFP56_42147 [Quercus suber]